MLDKNYLLNAADAILEGLQIEASYEALSKQRVLAYLVNTVGRQWLLAEAADVVLQKHHGGKELWTASRFCSKCYLIHTRLVSVTDDGSMVVAEVEECA